MIPRCEAAQLSTSETTASLSRCCLKASKKSGLYIFWPRLGVRRQKKEARRPVGLRNAPWDRRRQAVEDAADREIEGVGDRGRR
jgi:hypothetical protein